jgi:hypothetical protein
LVTRAGARKKLEAKIRDTKNTATAGHEYYSTLNHTAGTYNGTTIGGGGGTGGDNNGGGNNNTGGGGGGGGAPTPLALAAIAMLLTTRTVRVRKTQRAL